MKITAFEEYGLRCLVQLAKHHHEQRPVAISEIAKAEGLSIQYVGKIMHELRRGGLITSSRGIHGGFTLAKAPQSISVTEVFEIMGSETPEHLCTKYAGNLSQCIHTGSCTIRPIWSFIMGQVNEVLSGVSLADLAQTDISPNSKVSQHLNQFDITRAPLMASAGGTTK